MIVIAVCKATTHLVSFIKGLVRLKTAPKFGKSLFNSYQKCFPGLELISRALINELFPDREEGSNNRQ